MVIGVILGILSFGFNVEEWFRNGRPIISIFELKLLERESGTSAKLQISFRNVNNRIEAKNVTLIIKGFYDSKLEFEASKPVPNLGADTSGDYSFSITTKNKEKMDQILGTSKFELYFLMKYEGGLLGGNESSARYQYHQWSKTFSRI